MKILKIILIALAIFFFILTITVNPLATFGMVTCIVLYCIFTSDEWYFW